MVAKLESIPLGTTQGFKVCREGIHPEQCESKAVDCRNTHMSLKAMGRHKNSSLVMPKLLQSILSSEEIRPVSNLVKHTASESGCKAQQSWRSLLHRSSHQAPPHPSTGGPPAQCLPIAPLFSHCSPHLRWAVPDLGGTWCSRLATPTRWGRKASPCMQLAQMQELKSGILQCDVTSVFI